MDTKKVAAKTTKLATGLLLGIIILQNIGTEQAKSQSFTEIK